MIHEYSLEGQPSVLITSFASSYAKVLDHLYGALGCLIKAHIHLYEMRSTASTVLGDVPRSLQPLLDLHRNRRRMLELARAELNVLEAIIREVRPLAPLNL